MNVWMQLSLFGSLNSIKLHVLSSSHITQSKKAHIEEIRSDAESLKKMKQQQKQSKVRTSNQKLYTH